LSIDPKPEKRAGEPGGSDSPGRRRFGVSSALDLLPSRSAMVRLEMGFRPGWFERKMIRQTKHDILRRLEGHQFGPLRIVLKKRDGRVAFQFFGDTGSVEKAKNLLGIC
jgi:hypothetical protein